MLRHLWLSVLFSVDREDGLAGCCSELQVSGVWESVLVCAHVWVISTMVCRLRNGALSTALGASYKPSAMINYKPFICLDF